jgi:hypothetical protein
MSGSRPRSWRLASHGPRPSTLLCAGAILGALGPLLVLAGEAAAGWLCWYLSLLLVGSGLLLSGLRPWLTAFAVVPGALYLLQGVAFSLAVFGLAPAASAHELLAMPKLVSLVLLAAMAVRQIDRRRRRLLAVVAAATALKPLLRHLDALPAGAAPYLDAVLGAALAWALAQTAVVLRRLETAWQVRRWQEANAALEDFDAPPLPPIG